MRSNVVKLVVNYFFKPVSPLSTVLYLTNVCNLKCGFCDIGVSNASGHKHKIAELSKSQIDKIIEAMVKMGTREIYITGGEPFLAKNLWYLLELCSKNSILVDGITTNGSFLNKLSDEQIALLNKSNVKRIIISLDYADVDKHDSLRGQSGLFADIEYFLRSQKAGRIKTCFCVSTVINGENYTELTKLIEWCSAIKSIRHINFQPVCIEPIFVDFAPKGNGKKSFIITRDILSDLEMHLARALEKANELNISTTLPFSKVWFKEYFEYAETDVFFFNKVMRGFVCSKPYNFLHINYNGELLACAHIGPIGNINDGDIVETWRGAAQKYRNILKNGKYFSKCRSCFCDFAANYRYSLIYKPLKNGKHIVKMASYYIDRYMRGTK